MITSPRAIGRTATTTGADSLRHFGINGNLHVALCVVNEITNRCRPVHGSLPPCKQRGDVAACKQCDSVDRPRRRSPASFAMRPACDSKIAGDRAVQLVAMLGGRQFDRRQLAVCRSTCPARIAAWRFIGWLDACTAIVVAWLRPMTLIATCAAPSIRSSRKIVRHGPPANLRLLACARTAACPAPAQASAAIAASRRRFVASADAISATSPNRTTERRSRHALAQRNVAWPRRPSWQCKQQCNATTAQMLTMA